MERERIETAIYDLENEIAALESEIENFELDPYDFEESYCDFMDEEGEVSVFGLTFMPSDIVKEMDPTAYRCGLIDYVDGLDLSDSEEYQEMVEKLEDLAEELTELENKLEELEEEK